MYSCKKPRHAVDITGTVYFSSAKEARRFLQQLGHNADICIFSVRQRTIAKSSQTNSISKNCSKRIPYHNSIFIMPPVSAAAKSNN